MAGTISTGPRTQAGKARAACNALRHGLAATHRRQHVPADAVERLAVAICGGEDDPELLAAARAIAESAFVLSAIRQQKIIVIERLKEATAIALRKGDNSFDLAKARFMQAWLAHREIQKLVPQVMKKYESEIVPPIRGRWTGMTSSRSGLKRSSRTRSPVKKKQPRTGDSQTRNQAPATDRI